MVVVPCFCFPVRVLRRKAGMRDAFFSCSSVAGFAEVESGLPFAVEGHPSAKSHVAKEMLRRLKEDVQYFAKEVSAPSAVLNSFRTFDRQTDAYEGSAVQYPTSELRLDVKMSGEVRYGAARRRGCPVLCNAVR